MKDISVMIGDVKFNFRVSCPVKELTGQSILIFRQKM